MTLPALGVSPAPSRAAIELDAHGLAPAGNIHWNLSPAQLCEAALARGEGHLVNMGPFAAVTVPHTGRSPNDRYTVEEPSTADQIDWGSINRPMSEAHYRALRADIIDYLNPRELFVRDAHCGADPGHRISVRVVSPSAWHTLFVYNMFLRPSAAELAAIRPDFVVLHAPLLQADPARHGTRSGTAVVVNLAERTVLVAGTRYAGEIKKSIFSSMNYFLPGKGALPMHCSANIGENGDSALFFGLSGTGKTTLSADHARRLIGDDEHGWSDDGVFNFEGGCYAKVIRLSPENEPEIYRTTRMFGTILENVIFDEDTREVDLDDDTLTENTRASYPIHYIPGAVPEGRGGHPKNIFFLTADAFGVLPPIARLTPEQAMYHFLSGYTAKVAGTERGVTEPRATFSACFGAPFLPMHPSVYARILGEKLRRHGSRVWLVNTGWTGGGFGTGKRMDLPHTRAMIRAALDGSLDGAPTRTDPVFGLAVPLEVEGVPAQVLTPRSTWADPAAYDRAAARLAAMFRENFSHFAEASPEEVRAAGPK
jgi:phosphoenolpyruvate carboxykinase (ATP)